MKVVVSVILLRTVAVTNYRSGTSSRLPQAFRGRYDRYLSVQRTVEIRFEYLELKTTLASLVIYDHIVVNIDAIIYVSTIVIAVIGV